MQRNMSTNQRINSEHGQQAQPSVVSGSTSNNPQPSANHMLPSAVYGSTSNNPQPSANHMLSVSEPVSGFVPQHLSAGSGENLIPYGMSQYNAVLHHPLPGNLGPATTSNYVFPHMSQPGSSLFHSQLNQGPMFVDVFGVVYSRKIPGGYLGSYPRSYSVAGPSSAVPLTMEVGSQQNVRPGPLGAGPSSSLPSSMEFGSQPSMMLGPVVATPSSGGDGGTWGWTQAPAIPYMQGAGNITPEQYQEAINRQSSTNFQPYPPLMYPVQGLPQSFHLQPQPVLGAFYSQVPGPSYGPIGNTSSHANVHPFPVNMEVAPGYVGPVPSTGLGFYHPPHGRALVPGVTINHPALTNSSLLTADEVAMLQNPRYFQMVNAAVDQHRELRMDVDGMTHEELLALQDRMGYVRTGLSEDAISRHLQTRTHISSTTSMVLADQETDFCTICQANYKNQDKIGKLDCGHEYHVDCVKKWLVLKNTCPICKSSALAAGNEDSARQG